MALVVGFQFGKPILVNISKKYEALTIFTLEC